MKVDSLEAIIGFSALKKQPGNLKFTFKVLATKALCITKSWRIYQRKVDKESESRWRAI